MMALDEVETPAVLVELDVLDGNLARMADAARRHGVRLRPHAKTHKTAEIARMQLRAGAAGLCLAKSSEAEAFARAGFEDVFIAYPVVGAEKARRLLALSESMRLSVGVDSEEGASSLASAFRAAARRLDVLLKVDVGFHRVGVAPEAAVALAQRLSRLPGLRLCGVFSFAGHAYSAATPAAVGEVGRAEASTLVETAAALRAAGLPCEEVSVGSTPTASHGMATPGVTECRPGVYVFNDGSQVDLGTATLEQCALTVLATVVSVPGPRRAVLDAGSKCLSSDPLRPRAGGHGRLWGRESRIAWMSEEHGVVEVAEGESFRVGDRVRIVPNHACVVANLADRLLGVRSGRVEAELRLIARGHVA
jgi:D-serine deaminase-like pyridoxal phosphate-dependent protein